MSCLISSGNKGLIVECCMFILINYYSKVIGGKSVGGGNKGLIVEGCMFILIMNE